MKKTISVWFVVAFLILISGCTRAIKEPIDNVNSSILSYSDLIVIKETSDQNTRYSVSAIVNNNAYGTVSTAESQANTYGAVAYLTATENESEFLFWLENGRIVSKDKYYTFIITENHELEAYFVPNNRRAVVYVDKNDYLIDFLLVYEKDINITTSKLPFAKRGFKFIGFNDLKEVIDNTYIYAKYELIADDCNVSVVNGNIKNSNKSLDAFGYGSTVTVTTSFEDFSYWQINGHVVSYQKEYSFTVIENMTLTAVLDGGASKKFSANIQKLTVNDAQLMAIGSFVNPNNLPVIEVGLIISFGEENTGRNISAWTNAYQMRAGKLSSINEFVMFYDIDLNTTIHVCTYVKTNNGTETNPVYITHYSNIETYQYI